MSEIRESVRAKRTMTSLNQETEPRDFRTPDQRLCAAMVCRAVLDLFSDANIDFNGGRAGVSGAVTREAWGWIFSSGARREYDFEYCCAHAGLDPMALRERIKYMLKHKIKVARGPKFFRIFQDI